MSESMGPLTFGKKEEQIFLGREIAQHQDYSEDTAIKIDQEVKGIVTDAVRARPRGADRAQGRAGADRRRAARARGARRRPGPPARGGRNRWRKSCRPRRRRRRRRTKRPGRVSGSVRPWCRRCSRFRSRCTRNDGTELGAAFRMDDGVPGSCSTTLHRAPRGRATPPARRSHARDGGRQRHPRFVRRHPVRPSTRSGRSTWRRRPRRRAPTSWTSGAESTPPGLRRRGRGRGTAAPAAGPPRGRRPHLAARSRSTRPRRPSREAALDAGAAIVNDISGLRYDAGLGRGRRPVGRGAGPDAHARHGRATMYEQAVVRRTSPREVRRRAGGVAGGRRAGRRPARGDDRRPGPGVREAGRAQLRGARPPRRARGARSADPGRQLAEVVPARGRSATCRRRRATGARRRRWRRPSSRARTSCACMPSAPMVQVARVADEIVRWRGRQ